MKRTCTVGVHEIGPGRPLAIIAGPCTLESKALALEVGERMRDACAGLGLAYVFKASYDKANRSRLGGARGPGLEEGLGILGEIREALGVPVTTDVHEPGQCAAAAEVVDLLQIPAFLCRQTDLLAAAGEAAGAHAVFLETHPDPSRAWSDGATMIPLAEAPGVVSSLAAIRSALESAAV